MTQKIISQSPVNVAELHAELNRIQGRDKELGFRAQKALDYVQSLGTLDEKKAKELMEKLLKLDLPRLRDMHFHKIVDLMPTAAKDVKTILQGYNVTVSQDNCKKIADIVAEFV